MMCTVCQSAAWEWLHPHRSLSCSISRFATISAIAQTATISSVSSAMFVSGPRNWYQKSCNWYQKLVPVSGTSFLLPVSGQYVMGIINYLPLMEHIVSLNDRYSITVCHNSLTRATDIFLVKQNHFLYTVKANC